jgi:hypothetical protein
MTNAHSSSCSRDHHEANDHVCLALVRENGMDVVVFDATGVPRTFRSKHSHPPKKLCFSSHGDHDEWLTPCLDADGHHGTPEESCFCGIETPHLHAHIHDPKQCDVNITASSRSNKTADPRIGWLASQTLFPSTEDASRIPITDSLPKECNASLTNERRRWKSGSRRLHYSIHHEDHEDALVHNADTNQLHLEHDCVDCGRPDVHGTFQSLGQRRWKQVQLHFFAISQRPFSFMESWMDLFEPHSGDAVQAVDRLVPSSSSPTATTTTKARSQWHVQNICCASEIPLLRHALDRYSEQIEMSVNTTTKMVYVRHDPASVTAADLTAALAGGGFTAVLRVDGAAAGATFSVTSILQLEEAASVNTQETVGVLLQQQVDTADSFPLLSIQMLDQGRISVVHNPFDVTASHLAARCTNDWGIPVKVVQDGADPAVWKSRNEEEKAQQQSKHSYPAVTVMMSGLLWVISLLSYIGGNWYVPEDR